ncbi:MAG: type II toxin-antitoxin system RelE/ParE family toxin [Thermomicrobiales bacterium]|nr:type II toxin-antitoxin system RelE/ParE family toxin [Thermomicrobiales bacterium]
MAALQDLDDILQYTMERWDDEQAIRYAGIIDEGLDRLRHFPQIGTIRLERGIEFRLFPIEQHLAIYQIQGEIILIVRIVHRQSAWPQLD